MQKWEAWGESAAARSVQCRTVNKRNGLGHSSPVSPRKTKSHPPQTIVNCIHPNWFLYMAGGRSLRMICIYFFTARTRPLHQPQTARAYTLIRHLILTRPPALWIFRTAVSGTWGPRHSRTPSRSRGGPVTCNARNCNEGGHNHQDIVTVVTVWRFCSNPIENTSDWLSAWFFYNVFPAYKGPFNHKSHIMALLYLKSYHSLKAWMKMNKKRWFPG